MYVSIYSLYPSTRSPEREREREKKRGRKEIERESDRVIYNSKIQRDMM